MFKENMSMASRKRTKTSSALSDIENKHPILTSFGLEWGWRLLLLSVVSIGILKADERYVKRDEAAGSNKELTDSILKVTKAVEENHNQLIVQQTIGAKNEALVNSVKDSILRIEINLREMDKNIWTHVQSSSKEK